MSVHTDRLTLITLASRFNEWQGFDAQVSAKLLGALIWTLSMDPELQKDLGEAVETERRYEQMMRAELDGESEQPEPDRSSSFDDEATAERDSSARLWKQD